jgi:ABC-type multidrug transport system ATPase subunit
LSKFIDALDVWKSYGRKSVLKGIDISIDSPTTFVILGKNGVGKTTLIKLLSGLLIPTKGKILIFGEDIRYNYSYKEHVGVLLHDNVLYEELTVNENLSYYAKMYGLNDITESKLGYMAYEILGLESYSDTKVAHLSFGWRKRANFIKALLNDPSIILLDEPISGLDETASGDIVELVSTLSEDRVVLLTISNIDDLRPFMDKGCVEDDVYRLEDGRLKHDSDII